MPPGLADEEHGKIPCSESIGQPVLGPIKNKIANGRFQLRQRLVKNGTVQRRFCGYIIQDREDLRIKLCFDQHQWFLH